MKNIITIFNYPKNDINYTKMCLIWLNQVKKYGDNFNVKILTENGVNDTLRDTISDLEFTLIQSNSISVNNPDIKGKHNIGFKLYNLCNETEPFIFIDADAFVLKDLDILSELSDNQPFVAINHETIPKHTSHIPYKFLNSGVQVCNDPSILDFEKIINCKIVCPGTDQSLLYSYFKKIGYDYTNKNIGFEWNSYAKYVELSKNGDEWVGVSKGLDYEHPVHINHYWFDAKPWLINCEIFKEYGEKAESIFV